MSRRLVSLVFILAAAAWLAGTGCSKSSTSQASSESSSDSSRSSSGSSGSSSRSSGNAAYIGDVRDTTEKWVLSGSDADAFQRDLAKTAEDNGITDWQSDQATYEGIGRGLKRSRVSGARQDQLKQALTQGNTQYMQWVQKGFDSEST